MKKIILVLGIVLVVGITFGLTNRERISPDDVINKLHDGIAQAQAEGSYHCCIEPACTMCYLSKWKFEKGTCYCDDAIAKGNFEDVCPECKKGTVDKACGSTGVEA